MTDQIDDDGEDAEHTEAFNMREDVLEEAMPVLAEFFHIVRCPNHSKADRSAAYEAACEAWDRLEEVYVGEIAMLHDDDDDSPHGEHGGDGEHASDAIPRITHPGSRAIN